MEKEKFNVSDRRLVQHVCKNSEAGNPKGETWLIIRLYQQLRVSEDILTNLQMTQN